MKTFKQFREENYKQSPGPYSGGYDYPIPKGYPRDIMSKPIVDKEKGKFLNEPKFKKFLKDNPRKDGPIWRSFYPDNKKEYLNRDTMMFQDTPPKQKTKKSALETKGNRLPPG